MKHVVVTTFIYLLATCSVLAARADTASSTFALAGTYSLVAADVIKTDGARVRDYGDAPKGRLIIDAQGRYSLQIYKSERPRFASDNKLAGTPAEFEAAMLGSSVHFGTLQIDPAAGDLIFSIEGASFPNWEGTRQKRHYQFNGDELSYRVPPRPDGGTPVSVWRRLK
jgi:hypothetical protein